MNSALVKELFERIDELPIVDAHTHVNWKSPNAASIGDILSYHYYTELCNSADFQDGKFPFTDPEALTRVILPKLDLIRNTVQYDWLMTISREFLMIDPLDWHEDNWKFIYDRSVEVMSSPDWRDELLAQANIERVFLTNQYSDDLEGLDTTLFTPCLRVEPFIIWMDNEAERERIGNFLGRPVLNIADVRAAIDKAFAKFVSHDMGYAAMSIPTNLQTFYVPDEDADRVLRKMCRRGHARSASSGTRLAWAASPPPAASTRNPST